MRILYLTHDTSDPTTLKRVRMLMAGGAEVTVAGFHRSEARPTIIENASITDFGRTYPARFLHRIGSVLRTRARIHQHKNLFDAADLILARNLEMLAIATRGRALSNNRAPLVYECLDIHRLLLRTDIIGKCLRTIEGNLAKQASLLITSSPAFIREYFEKISHVKLPSLLVENKVLRLEGDITPPPAPRAQQPWRIGWFGVLRCRQSFDALCALVTAHPGLVEVTLRGRPAYDQLPDFDARVATTPGLTFGGPYTHEDLAEMYAGIHFTWAIDRFEAGQNSEWLLPNRLYDSGYYGSVPLALTGVETSNFMRNLTIGHSFLNLTTKTLADFFHAMDTAHYTQLRSAVLATPRSTWRTTHEDCVQLVKTLQNLTPQPRTAAQPPSTKPTLVIIPTLNEAKHLPALLEYLVIESATAPLRIVVADGGSTDGTIAIAERYANAYDIIHYLPNPKRIQSAAINLVVEQFGDDADYLIRLDAHAHYPRGYCTTLLDEAAQTGADSVVVSMHTRANAGFQTAIALAQNSKLGNGGSAHRTATESGKWVEHGHHALMSIAAFRAVGGYDETFTHNEDAELDIRLARAGYRHWLTAKTALDYFPRATATALFRQYRHYGRGRARTIIKHQLVPRLRQTLPLLVVPALALALLTPLTPLALLPLALWVSICLGYGALLAYRKHHRIGLLSGPAAMVMHTAWSLGFWQELLIPKVRA